MDTKIKNYLGAVGVLLMVVFAVSALWYVSSFSNSVGSESSFSVTGEGEIVAVPDIAEFTYRVITEGGTNITPLQEENSSKINSANEFLKENGIEDEDIRTSSYSVNPRYQYYSCEEGPCPPPEIVGYSISQSVTVKVRDFSVIGDLLSGVVERGANSVSGLSFTIDDPTELRNEARTKAIEQAKEKAEAIAEAGDFRIGKLLSLNENVSSPYYYLEREEALGMGGADSSVPSIEPGSQDVKINVTLRYEIR